MCNVPSPRWNVTCSAFGLQGGGLYISGHGNTDQHQRVLESGILGALTFCPCLAISSIAPMERYVLAFGLQGGGLHISGTATLTNTNVYSNQQLGVSVCDFEPSLSLTCPPSPHWYAHCDGGVSWQGWVSFASNRTDCTNPRVNVPSPHWYCSLCWRCVPCAGHGECFVPNRTHA